MTLMNDEAFLAFGYYHQDFKIMDDYLNLIFTYE